MKYILAPIFSNAPQSFKRWLKRHSNLPYKSIKDSRVKTDLKSSLINNQDGICCYCQSRISLESSHIEHIEPQYGGVSKKTTQYSNMAASCIKDPKKFDEADIDSFTALNKSLVHCGHSRGTNKVASPYDPICEKLFSYSYDGKIYVNKALDDLNEIALADESIQYLNLNVATLVHLRKLAIYQTIKLLNEGVPAENILAHLKGKLLPFVSLAKFAISQWNKYHA